MQCPNSCTAKPYVHGHYGKQKTPRFKCPRCGRTFSPKANKPCAALKIPTQTLYRILDCLTEGCGIRSTARLDDVHPETVLKVLRIAGEKAETVLDREMRNISAEHVQIDELWTFVYKKDKRVRPGDPKEFGDQWVFAAVTEHKLIPCYTLGKREPPVALEFIQNVRSRIDGRFQLNSDGWGTYIPIVEEVFGANVDYAQAIKDYGPTESGRERYSPSDFVSIQRKAISGNPERDLITTSHVERTNLTTLTRMRRFTRLALGFSKKKAYLAAALAIHFYAYNFMTIHSTIRCTPAMEAEITNTIWTWADLFAN